MMQNKDLHNLYSLPNILIIRTLKSRRMRWAWHVACMATNWNAWRILVGKPEGKSPVGRRR
jgi:hypothetical protein